MRTRKNAKVIDVTYQRDALTIKVGDRNIGQGCMDGVPGPTVTRERVGDVVRVLAPCLQALRGRAPDLTERVVKIRLEAAAPLSSLVALVEAFRAADFTAIVLQAPVEPTR